MLFLTNDYNYDLLLSLSLLLTLKNIIIITYYHVIIIIHY